MRLLSLAIGAITLAASTACGQTLIESSKSKVSLNRYLELSVESIDRVRSLNSTIADAVYARCSVIGYARDQNKTTLGYQAFQLTLTQELIDELVKQLTTLRGIEDKYMSDTRSDLDESITLRFAFEVSNTISIEIKIWKGRTRNESEIGLVIDIAGEKSRSFCRFNGDSYKNKSSQVQSLIEALNMVREEIRLNKPFHKIT